MKPTVLFVDDEINILRGLKRFTRNRRHDWQMEFFEKAIDASDYINQNPVDIIVSDMRMPEMNGADLLEHISKTNPHIIRIILSGEAELSQTYRTVGRSHRFLAKPCDQDELLATIERLLQHKKCLNLEGVTNSISIFDQLQSPQENFEHFGLLLEDETSTDEELINFLEKDPCLTVRIFQLANSAYFGKPLATTSLKRALNHIGRTSLRELLKLKRLGNANPVAIYNDRKKHLYNLSFQLTQKITYQALQQGLSEKDIDTAISAALFVMLSALQNENFQHEKELFFKAAYLSELLGMPEHVSSFVYKLKGFNLEKSVEENTQIICAVLKQTQANAA